jgi:hypothetical protein
MISLPSNGRPPGNIDRDVNRQRVLDLSHARASVCNCILIEKAIIYAKEFK